MITRHHAFTGLLIAVLVAGALLSGCGQKGPLYLPDETAQQQQQKKPPAKP